MEGPRRGKEGARTEVVDGDAAVGESARGAVRVEVAAVGLPVGAGQRAQVVVGAHVGRGVADDEQRRGQRRRRLGRGRRGPPGSGGKGEQKEEEDGEGEEGHHFRRPPWRGSRARWGAGPGLGRLGAGPRRVNHQVRSGALLQLGREILGWI